MKLSMLDAGYKQKILDAHKVLLKSDMMELNTGHQSARIPGTDLICTIGHLHDDGRTLDTLTADDLQILDLDGNIVDGRLSPIEEIFIHTEVYRARPEINSVLHTHPMLCTCFSIAGVEIQPVNQRGRVYYPSVPIWDFAGLINTPALGREMMTHMGRRCALLLKGHGVVTAGTSVEECTSLCVMLERTAKMQLIATALGGARPLTVQDFRDENFFSRDMGNWGINVWGFLAHTYLED